MTTLRRPIISFAEFINLTLNYMQGECSETYGHRIYRNEEHGLQVEIVTARKENGDWHKGQRYYYLDGDEQEYENAEDCYNAYRQRRWGEAVDL